MQERNGLTLVELVVVSMILGIFATIAVPKFHEAKKRAAESELKETLSAVREAIQWYASQHRGFLPGQNNDLAADLDGYLIGDFPSAPVGVKNAAIAYATGTLSADVDPTAGWKYSTDTGQFICNSVQPTLSDPSTSYADL